MLFLKIFLPSSDILPKQLADEKALETG